MIRFWIKIRARSIVWKDQTCWRWRHESSTYFDSTSCCIKLSVLKYRVSKSRKPTGVKLHILYFVFIIYNVYATHWPLRSTRFLSHCIMFLWTLSSTFFRTPCIFTKKRVFYVAFLYWISVFPWQGKRTVWKWKGFCLWTMSHHWLNRISLWKWKANCAALFSRSDSQYDCCITPVTGSV